MHTVEMTARASLFPGSHVSGSSCEVSSLRLQAATPDKHFPGMVPGTCAIAPWPSGNSPGLIFPFGPSGNRCTSDSFSLQFSRSKIRVNDLRQYWSIKNSEPLDHVPPNRQSLKFKNMVQPGGLSFPRISLGERFTFRKPDLCFGAAFGRASENCRVRGCENPGLPHTQT